MVDWSYYNSHFSNLTESEFNKVIDTAESFINIRGRKNIIDDIELNVAEDTSDVRLIPYKNAICGVAEKLFVKMESIRDVNSISNDGYSESYASQIDDEAVQIAKFYLAGTGIWGLQYV